VCGLRLIYKLKYDLCVKLISEFIKFINALFKYFVVFLAVIVIDSNFSTAQGTGEVSTQARPQALPHQSHGSGDRGNGH
jgi:hypothetical protein